MRKYSALLEKIKPGNDADNGTRTTGPAELKFEENFWIRFEPGTEALCMFYRDCTLTF